MADKPRVAIRERVTLLDRGDRFEIQHEAPKTGSGEWGYDWSCIQVNRTEAKWLAAKLLAWIKTDKGGSNV